MEYPVKTADGLSSFLPGTLKFIYSEKATKFCKISIVDLSFLVKVKSTVEISQNFVEHVNFENPVADFANFFAYLFFFYSRFIYFFKADPINKIKNLVLLTFFASCMKMNNLLANF